MSAKLKYDKSDIIFLNDEGLKKYQSELLKMISDIFQFFDKHGIHYSLSGGSILGAVRHKGFIPWDDDVDINIPRESYDKLVSLCNTCKDFSDHYYLQSPNSHPELGLHVSQIRKRGTVARRKYDYAANECGISIDLYIVENVFDNPVKRFLQGYTSMFLTFALASVRETKNHALMKEMFRLEGRKLNYSAGKLMVGWFFGIIPIRKWLSWLDKCNSSCKDSNTKYVSIPTGRKHFRRETYLRENMNVYKKVPFETEMVNIPIWSEEYLEMFYGKDYMVVPSEDKREQHLFLELKYEGE